MPFAILVEMPFIVAHAAHWVIYALYAIPFLVVGLSIVTTVLRQRREDAGSHDSGQA